MSNFDKLFSKIYEGKLVDTAGKIEKAWDKSGSWIQRKTSEQTAFGKLRRAKRLLNLLGSEYIRAKDSLRVNHHNLKTLVQKSKDLKAKVQELYKDHETDDIKQFYTNLDDLNGKIVKFADNLLDALPSKDEPKEEPKEEPKDEETEETEETEEKPKVKKPISKLKDLGWSKTKISKMSTKEAIYNAKNNIKPKSADDESESESESESEKDFPQSSAKKDSVSASDFEDIPFDDDDDISFDPASPHSKPKVKPKHSREQILRMAGYTDNKIKAMDDQEIENAYQTALKGRIGKKLGYHTKKSDKDILSDSKDIDKEHQLFCEVFESEMELL